VQTKQSGVDWLGHIPQDWDTVRIGAIYQARNVKVSDKDYMPLSVGYMGVVPQLENAAKTDDNDNRKLVLKNDFVINSRADRRGACGISELDGSVSLINIVLKPLKSGSNDYFRYMFKSTGFSDEFYKWGTGIVDDLWSTKWTEMKRIRIPVPPIKTQKRIATFLDKQIAIIDHQIEANKKAIDLLGEYRASEINTKIWSGKYKTERMRFHTMVRNEKGQTTDNFIGLENIESYTGRYVETETIPNEEDAKKFYNGDLLINRLRPYLTKSLLANKDGTCTGELVVIKHYDGYIKYLMYLTLSHKYISLLESSVFGAKMPRANWDFIKNISIPIKPITEQKEIVAYLDKKCKQIDQIIAYRKTIIEKLEEYKKSLIYETVTGKKEI